eukprot:403331492
MNTVFTKKILTAKKGGLNSYGGQNGLPRLNVFNNRKNLLTKKLANESYLRVVRYMTFQMQFTKLATINKDTRKLVFEKYEVLCKERSITVDLSGTTKILKKLPIYIAKRLNYLGVIMRQDARLERVDRLLEFFRPFRGRMRLMLELNGMDDSDRDIKEVLKRFKDIPIRRLVVKKCNFQEQKTQGLLLKDCIQLYLIDSFVKFWIKDKIKVNEIVVKKSTIIYGKCSVPVFPEAKRFICRDSYIKNPEFAWRPITETVEELVLLGNDYYGVLNFNIVYHVVFYMKKFCNLRILEFEGQVDEETFIKLLINMQHYKQLTRMVFINKGAFFNLKMVMNNTEVQALNIIDKPLQISKVTDDTSRIHIKFTLPEESLQRTIDFTFLNY